MSTQKNPLQIIEEWLSGIEETLLEELIGLAGHFHPNSEIAGYSHSERLRSFVNYLTEPGISNRETVLRTFIVMKLIDHAMSGRDSEQGWTRSLDLNLSIREKAKDIADRFLDTYHQRKDAWLNLAQSWYALCENELTHQEIADWHFFESRKTQD